MILSLPRLDAPARRTRLSNPTIARRARFVAAFVLPGVVAFASRAAQANPYVELSWIAGMGKNGTSFAVPLSVAIDPRRGDVAIANTGRGRIEILAPDGSASVFFDHRVRGADGNSVLGKPRVVRFDAAGRLLVTDDLDAGVDILDYRGRVIGRLEIPSTADGAEPADTVAGAVLPLKDGSVLVATRSKRGRIHRFDGSGRWIGAWGESGTKPGQLARITSLAQAPSGEILVACSATELAIQRFNQNGSYVAGFGQHEIGTGNFSFPSGIAVTADGRIWVSDQLRQTVQIFSAKGEYEGTAGEGGPQPGAFLFPSDVATDGKDRLAVVERVGVRVQMFRILDPEAMFRAPERR